MTKRYKYNTLCKECSKDSIEEKVYVGHWSYEKISGGIKTEHIVTVIEDIDGKKQ